MTHTIHLKAPSNWINDPNGFIYYRGLYHVFYQQFPYEPKWGRMHRGHAVSKDLVHWEHQKIALFPSKYDDRSGCYSGSAVEYQGKLYLYYTGMNYLEENPEATPEELAAAVGGPPDRCAAELLAELDPAVVSACRRRKRLYLYLLIAALLVLVVFLACLAKSLYENGGLVIIERGHYESAEDMPPPPKEGTMIIEYHYDD